MHAAPALRGGLALRSLSLLAGLFLFAVGIVCLLESELGLSPWDVLNQGIAEHTPLSFGAANVAVSMLIIGVDWRLGARIGVGTLANGILVGLFVDLLIRVGAFEALGDGPLAVRVALLAGGILVIGLGSALYIGANMGAGPRDSLMLVGARRTGARVGVVRTVLEAGATLAGWALGGTVGIGTLAFALGVGPAVEAAFWTLTRTPLTDGEVASAA